MNPLNTFYNDSQMREAVYNFLIEQLANTAVTAAFLNGSVSGIKEAKELIDTAFSLLESTYGQKKKITHQSTR